MRVRYDSDMPAEVRAALQPLIERWAWVLPATCHELGVVFHPAATPDVEPETLAAMETASEYREAVLFVFGLWLQESKAARERVIVHELAHVVAAPLAELADYFVAKTNDPTLKEWAAEQSRRACESVVCDMTEALLRSRLSPKNRERQITKD